MSNRSNGAKNIEVLNIVSDQNPYTGERFYRVDIGTQVPIPKEKPLQLLYTMQLQ